MKPPGRIKRKLAKALQRDFPMLGTHPITWKPERIYEAKGGVRTSLIYDAYRWSATAVFQETGNTACVVDSFCTATQCAYARQLVKNENEIEVQVEGSSCNGSK